MQFGAKPLFENVSVKFNNGNRYGLIGANGCGKSTFMKILGGDLEPSAGQVMLEPNVRLGKLRQDQFAYEEFNVIDTVITVSYTHLDVYKRQDQVYDEQFSLNDRDRMLYPVLIGRRTLEHLGAVDASRTFTLQPKCGKRTAKT